MASTRPNSPVQFDLFDDECAIPRAKNNKNAPNNRRKTAAPQAKPKGPSGFDPAAEQYLTDRQVAARFAVARQPVWRWMRGGRGFPAPVRICDGTTRWRLSDLIVFEQTLCPASSPDTKASRKTSRKAPSKTGQKRGGKAGQS